MQKNQTIVHVALPAKNEFEYIEETLYCLHNQNLKDFHTWICVNQPESYWENPEKLHICQNNKSTLELLRNYPLPHLHIIDHSSRGKGWQEGKLGVGMARSTIMNHILAEADDSDIIVSMDADTVFRENYLGSVSELFRQNPQAMGLANPYYHNLVQDEALNRAILRYEIYMRYYALNMRFTGSPYCFTPLGSAMAAPVWAYKKIGGLTPKKSGEDFYFLQKLTKSGKVLMYNDEIVYPGTRESDRVFFGTGPAVIKGLAGQWTAYPLFNLDLFEKVKQTIDLFPNLFHCPQKTPMDDFFREQFGCADIFAPLRSNHKNPERFVKACHEKLDGLRILQFLKDSHNRLPGKDEDNLRLFLKDNFNIQSIELELEELNFSNSPVENINKIRNFLFETELDIQRKHAG
jgi:cellulose synthase/poly-beta-1,6-N-acetylglucosamine synthase-like glycosyltransferase